MQCCCWRTALQLGSWGSGIGSGWGHSRNAVQLGGRGLGERGWGGWMKGRLQEWCCQPVLEEPLWGEGLTVMLSGV